MRIGRPNYSEDTLQQMSVDDDRRLAFSSRWYGRGRTTGPARLA